MAIKTMVTREEYWLKPLRSAKKKNTYTLAIHYKESRLIDLDRKHYIDR